jgi:sigma-54 dependent transcriptional regulator, acetoin dehydrogenase operon transcriptional activator AcoR
MLQVRLLGGVAAERDGEQVGLDRLEQQLEGKGFLRVHRRFLVNLSRIREIEPGFKGTLFLTTDTQTHETVPVARRHVPHLHQALGL